MPDHRLSHARATLPIGYQFGDARLLDQRPVLGAEIELYDGRRFTIGEPLTFHLPPLTSCPLCVKEAR